MRRGEGAEEDSPAEAVGNREAVADSRVGVGSPGLVVDNPVAVGIPAAEDSPVEAGTPAVEDSPGLVVDNPVAEDIRVVEDSLAAAGNRVEAGNRVVEDSLAAADIPAAAVDNSRAAAAPRRKSCRIWHKRCCPGLPAYRN
jgi:hypothetical protein